MNVAKLKIVEAIDAGVLEQKRSKVKAGAALSQETIEPPPTQQASSLSDPVQTFPPSDERSRFPAQDSLGASHTSTLNSRALEETQALLYEETAKTSFPPSVKDVNQRSPSSSSPVTSSSCTTMASTGDGLHAVASMAHHPPNTLDAGTIFAGDVKPISPPESTPPHSAATQFLAQKNPHVVLPYAPPQHSQDSTTSSTLSSSNSVLALLPSFIFLVFVTVR